MDWPKIMGYVGLTSVSISVAAHIAARIVPEQHIAAQFQDTVRWSGYLWAYASAAMGLFLYRLTRCRRELVWGGLIALLCLVLPFGLLAAIVYFFRSYIKIDKTDHGLPS